MKSINVCIRVNNTMILLSIDEKIFLLKTLCTHTIELENMVTNFPSYILHTRTYNQVLKNNEKPKERKYVNHLV